MRSKNWKNKSKIIVLLASMTVLVSCSSVKLVERVSPGGWLVLKQGQIYTAPRDITLAEEYVVKELQDELMDTIEILNKLSAQRALNDH